MFDMKGSAMEDTAHLDFCGDFYRFDKKLTEEETSIRDEIRKFVQQPEHVETVVECNDEGKPLPFTLLHKFALLGYVGANIPDENIPAEERNKISNLGYGIINREVEAADSAFRSAISVQGGLVMWPIYRFGTKEQKQRWLPSLRTYETIGCFGLSEEHGASDPSNMRTHVSEISAEDGGNYYLLNGSKNWITHAYSAQLAIVWAKIKNTKDQFRAFLVEKGTPGFNQSLIKRKGALRASETGMLAFTNCRVPKENMLPEALGMSAIYSCLNKARYGIAWGTGGIIRKCYQEILSIMQNRSLFMAPLASKQLVQEDLAMIDARLVTTQAICFRLAELADMRDQETISEKEFGEQISQAKWQCIELAIDAVSRCLELCGANGISYDYPFWAHFANLRVLQTYEGTKKIHTLIQGRRITGISAF